MVATTEILVFSTVLYPALGLAIGDFRQGPYPSLVGLTAAGAALFGFAMWLVGAYDHWHLRDWSRNASRIAIAYVILVPGFILICRQLAAIGHLPDPGGDVRSSPVLPGLCVTLAFTAALASRAGFGRIPLLPFVRQRILVLGVGSWAARIERLTQAPGEPGFAVMGYVAGAGERSELLHSRPLPGGESIVDLARRVRADEVVVASASRDNLPLSALLECRMNGIRVTDYLTFWERETGTVMLDALEPSWLIYSDGFNLGVLQHGLKRLLDVLLSGLFLILVLPLVIAAAIAVRLDSAGPIFHQQVRVGRNGVPFTIYKFRSMRTDAEKDGVPQWCASGDCRITRVGAVLRRLHIDEIPQILNVLRGDMSLVGPRPERPFFVEKLSQELRFYKERHIVRPGITGWAQINYRYGASQEDSKEKLAYDLYYVKNLSLGLDLITLFRTVQAILWPLGAP
ncbi:MAG: TIGR03013 family XrtA/PEP-CTERM system glycosyltransferase [Dongiaceae bacterium]